MGTIWNRSNTVEWDANGDRAEGALAYFYEAGTSTPRPVFEDAALSTPHDHPVEADGNGRWPAVFLAFGSYKETVTTAGNATLWSTDNIPNPEPFDETFELDTTATYNTGDFIFTGKNGTRPGAVRCNGRTMGNATSGGTERANADTADLFAYLWNNYLDAQAAVSTGRGASAVADYAANKTIALPDFRTAALIGFDDMGSTARGGAASAPVSSGSAILAGSIFGANTHVLLTAELAAHTHAITAQATGAGSAHTHGTGTFATTTTGSTHTHTVTDPQHTHITSEGTANSTVMKFLGAGGSLQPPAGSGTTTTSAIQNASTGITVNSNDGSHTHTFSGSLATESAHTHSLTGVTDANSGGGAHNSIARSIPVTVLMKL